MYKQTINLKSCSYPVIITQGYQELINSLYPLINNRVFVITDSHIEQLQFEKLNNTIKNNTEVIKYVADVGEGSKSLEMAEKIFEFFMRHRVRKSDVILAFGGGVVGDLTGFVASTYLRGVPFAQIPTTLLAQIDSSIGGKTGVDFQGIKNLIGTFYQPQLVYINTQTLDTLDIAERRNALAEAIVHSMIGDELLFNFIEKHYYSILNDSCDWILEKFISMNCAVKSQVVEEDEKENSKRKILNLGHTIGHAVESSSNYRLRHGEGVSLGLIGALYLAYDLGYTELVTVRKVYDLIKKVGLPYYYPELDQEEVMKNIMYDKKIKKGSSLTFIMPKQIGVVEICRLDEWEGKMRGVLNKIRIPILD